MRSFTLNVCLILFCLSVVGCGEKPLSEQTIEYNPRSLQPIRFFMTREEVRELWGQPSRYFYGHADLERMRVKREYFSPERYDEGVKKYGALQDVYYRRTPINQYEIKIEYKEDRSTNPDRPVMKAYEVFFSPFTLLPAKSTLNDLVEAVELCGGGCGMRGHQLVGSRIDVYPKFPTADQRDQAARMVRIWEPDRYKTRGEGVDWLPVITLFVQTEPEDIDRSVHEVQWMRLPIESVMLNFDTPEWNLRFDIGGRTMREQRIIELGSFHPPGEAQEKESEAK